MASFQELDDDLPSYINKLMKQKRTRSTPMNKQLSMLMDLRQKTDFERTLAILEVL